MKIFRGRFLIENRRVFIRHVYFNQELPFYEIAFIIYPNKNNQLS